MEVQTYTRGLNTEKMRTVFNHVINSTRTIIYVVTKEVMKITEVS